MRSPADKSNIGFQVRCEPCSLHSENEDTEWMCGDWGRPCRENEDEDCYLCQLEDPDEDPEHEEEPLKEPDLTPEVLMFIGRFSHGPKHPRAEVIECFRCGCCYWFAYILSVRFEEYYPVIMIDYAANHFGCKIGSEVYDIGGIVTNDFHWEPFRDCIDTALEQRIIEQCIMF